MASAEPYASLHLALDRYHASTPPLSILQAGCPSCHPTNSVKALKALIIQLVTTIMGRLTHSVLYLYFRSHSRYWAMTEPCVTADSRYSGIASNRSSDGSRNCRVFARQISTAGDTVYINQQSNIHRYQHVTEAFYTVATMSFLTQFALSLNPTKHRMLAQFRSSGVCYFIYGTFCKWIHCKRRLHYYYYFRK